MTPNGARSECKEKFRLLEEGLSNMALAVKEITTKLDYHGQNIRELRDEFKMLIKLLEETKINTTRLNNLEFRLNSLKNTIDKLIIWFVIFGLGTFFNFVIRHFEYIEKAIK